MRSERSGLSDDNWHNFNSKEVIMLKRFIFFHPVRFSKVKTNKLCFNCAFDQSLARDDCGNGCYQNYDKTFMTQKIKYAYQSGEDLQQFVDLE